jgi:hypothetical protein
MERLTDSEAGWWSSSDTDRRVEFLETVAQVTLEKFPWKVFSKFYVEASKVIKGEYLMITLSHRDYELYRQVCEVLGQEAMHYDEKITDSIQDHVEQTVTDRIQKAIEPFLIEIENAEAFNIRPLLEEILGTKHT